MSVEAEPEDDRRVLLPVDPTLLSGCRNTLQHVPCTFLESCGVSNDDLTYVRRVQRILHAQPNALPLDDGTYLIPREALPDTGYSCAHINPVLERKIRDRNGKVVCRFPLVTFQGD